MKTYRLRSGALVTSKDGDWPTTYANRTQAYRAAEKIPGAVVIQRGRPWYVQVPEPATTSEKTMAACEAATGTTQQTGCEAANVRPTT